MPENQRKPWTTLELKAASELWCSGFSLTQIAEKISRGRESVKHQVKARRDLFPRRREPRIEVRNDGRLINIKMAVSPFMYRAIKAEANRRNVSQNMLLREIIRETLIRKGKYNGKQT